MLPPPRLAGETSFGPYHPPPGWLDSLPRTTEEHQGEYTCEALNDNGKTETSAKLTVVKRGWILRIKWIKL